MPTNIDWRTTDVVEYFWGRFRNNAAVKWNADTRKVYVTQLFSNILAPSKNMQGPSSIMANCAYEEISREVEYISARGNEPFGLWDKSPFEQWAEFKVCVEFSEEFKMFMSGSEFMRN